MGSDRRVVVHFSLPNYSLAVMTGGTGSGTVSSDPGDILCGPLVIAGLKVCTNSYTSGTTVVLFASESTGSAFTSWTGCDSTPPYGCTIAMGADRTVTATFTAVAPTNYTLTVTKGGAGSGTVASSPDGILCGGTCAAPYASGTPVRLTPIADFGSAFSNWSGCDTVTINSPDCNMVMTGSKTVKAIFSAPGSQQSTLPLLAANVGMFASIDSTEADRVHARTYPVVGEDYMFSVANYDLGLPFGEFIAYQSLVRFDISPVSGKIIDSAVLTLEVQSPPIGYNPQDFKIGTVANTGWNPATVTWNIMATLPFFNDSWQYFSYPTTSGQKYEIDLSATVQKWANGDYPNNGIGIVSQSYPVPLNTAELNNYVFWEPTLIVTYH
jgi:hypothetical protein